MRRQMIMSGLVIGGVVVALGFPLAQENVAEIEQVKANLYVITGGGGNTAALVADDGVVLVDTKNPGWGSAILDKVQTVTDKPITHVVLTHYHAVCVLGASAFGAQQVIMSDNWSWLSDTPLVDEDEEAQLRLQAEHAADGQPLSWSPPESGGEEEAGPVVIVGPVVPEVPEGLDPEARRAANERQNAALVRAMNAVAPVPVSSQGAV